MIGDELKKYRQQKGLTQAELARAVGVNQGTLSRWERGEVSVPVERLKRIREELGLSVSDLAKIAFEPKQDSPPKSPAHITTEAHLTAWQTRVIADGPNDPNLKLLLFVLQNYVDKTSWVVSGTIPQIAASASLPVGMVEDLWEDLLKSPFVERVGSGEWTLRLVMPGEGGE